MYFINCIKKEKQEIKEGKKDLPNFGRT